MRLRVAAPGLLDDLKPGDSIATNGVCLTATQITGSGFIAEATSHTVAETTLGELKSGSRVNLERALRVGDRLGGHIVQGHIDAIGRTAKIRFGEGMTELTVELEPPILKFVAPRGSIAVNGVSLTVAEKSARWIRLTLVPFTLENTTLGELTPGARVNIETDLIVRWLADRFRDGEVVSSLEAGGWGSIHLEE